MIQMMILRWVLPKDLNPWFYHGNVRTGFYVLHGNAKQLIILLPRLRKLLLYKYVLYYNTY
jgi:hypothetical protein